MAKDRAEAALATLDGKIADLTRAQAELTAAMHEAPEPATARKPRKPRKPRGLPASDAGE